METEPDRVLRTLFDAAVAAADPARCVPAALPRPPSGRTVVVGGGKAAAEMAAAVDANWPGPLEGLVVTRHGQGAPAGRIEVAEAAHPVPDAAGVAASGRMLELVAGLGPDDLVLALISGGGSALMARPADGLTLADKQAVTDALLRSGATIGEINAVRKHLSAIKGGRLARAAHPANLVTLAISDVVGDDPATIASGPTVPDPSSADEARGVLERYGIAPPGRVAAWLASPACETPGPDDPAFRDIDYRIVASGATALEAAAETARNAGIEPFVLGDAVEGEAREVAAEHAALARDAAAGNPAWPLVFLSGGELTVTIAGSGRGGPNAEYLLALAIALDGATEIHALAADTDGIDGNAESAGAVIGPDTLARARAAGLDAAAMLAGNDSFGFFETLGDLVVTGPTGTNVNDFRAILVGAGQLG